MARAYLKRGSQSEEKVCGKCENNHDRIAEKVVYRIEDSELCFEDDYAHYWDSTGSEVTVYWCDHYDEWTTEEPETVETQLWVCGICTTEWHDEDDAVACCQGR